MSKIIGTSGSDRFVGTDGNDIIRGFGGRDTLIGGAGDDILVGGLDGDRLTGGEGNDLFVYNSFDERTDVITDFQINEDKLVLTNLFTALSYNGVDPIADGYMQFVQQGSNTRVQIDPDGINGSFPLQTIAILESVNAGDLIVGSNVII